jgi:hypothetical protein
VGIYFVTQNPLDLPESILGQLGNRVQHALRAYTPKDQKAVKAAADTFPSNPKLKVAEVITQLGVGEALVSVLQTSGAPTPVEQVFIAPPESRIGAITDAERADQVSRSPYKGQYETLVDRESAYEKLKARKAGPAAAPTPTAASSRDAALDDALGKIHVPSYPSAPSRIPTEPAPRRAVGRPADDIGTVLAKTVVRSVGSSIGSAVGRQLIRGVLGSLLGGSRR